MKSFYSQEIHNTQFKKKTMANTLTPPFVTHPIKSLFLHNSCFYYTWYTSKQWNLLYSAIEMVSYCVFSNLASFEQSHVCETHPSCYEEFSFHAIYRTKKAYTVSVGDRYLGCFQFFVVSNITIEILGNTSCTWTRLCFLDVRRVTGSGAAGSYGWYISNSTKMLPDCSFEYNFYSHQHCVRISITYLFQTGIRPFNFHPPHPPILPHYGFPWLSESRSVMSNSLQPHW